MCDIVFRTPRDALERLVSDLESPGAGFWRLADDRLELVEFVAGGSLPEETATSFAAATRSVPLDRISLAIVRAAVEREPIVSYARDLDPEVGSGYWLRRLGAERSIAAPILNLQGRPIGVVSIGVNGSNWNDEVVSELVRTLASRLVAFV